MGRLAPRCGVDVALFELDIAHFVERPSRCPKGQSHRIELENDLDQAAHIAALMKQHAAGNAPAGETQGGGANGSVGPNVQIRDGVQGYRRPVREEPSPLLALAAIAAVVVLVGGAK